jgi:AraC family transcriptional regulator of adaptative response/methylated-DNA-[protein]-cysteine methyltransferase
LLGENRDELLRELQLRFARARVCEAPPGFTERLQKVVHYLDDPGWNASLELPLDIRGTAFQRRVWEALRVIPAGTTVSYAQLALLVGKPRAARAVAAACAANTLAVAIPCHRAVASDGSLAGYRWGLERKRRLIAREKK